jgi:sensor histidine kinase YesM
MFKRLLKLKKVIARVNTALVFYLSIPQFNYSATLILSTVKVAVTLAEIFNFNFHIMKTKKPYKKELIYSIVFVILFSLGASMFTKWKQTGNPFVTETILYFLVMLLMSGLTGLLALKIFNYIEKKAVPKYIIPALFVFYIGGYAASYIAIIIGVFIWFIIKGRSLTEFFPHFFKYELPAPNSGLISWLLAITVMFFYIIWIRTLTREQKLREEKLQYQYQTLKQQVNPHFLFNSLTTLSSLINTLPGIAETFTDKLSSIYRYILDNGAKDKISLQAEIAFVTDYFYLYQIRDEGKVYLNITLDACNKCEIIPVSLQVLVENALKHNMASKERPLSIEIFCEKEHIIVKNNLQKMDTLVESAGIGLKNLGERIKLITGKELLVQETNKEFIVRIPYIITNENTNS